MSVPRRPDILPNTILGTLSDGPLHGYELRKRLAGILGPFRALSFGSLYPCLHRLTAIGLITQTSDASASSVSSRRARVIYALTADGKEAFATWVSDVGPDSWEDEAFAARLAFFGRTDAQVRLRILEGRSARLQERLHTLQDSLESTRVRMDFYAERLQRHGVEGAEREVTWLEELIAGERETRASLRRSRNRVSPDETRST